MDLFNLVAILTTVIGGLWLLEVCTLGVKRQFKARDLVAARADAALVLEQIKEPDYNIWMRRAFVTLLFPLLYLAIKKSMDFAILLVLANFVTGAVYLLDVLLVHRVRKSVVEELGETYKDQPGLQEQAAKFPELVEYSRSFFPVLAIVLVLRSFLIEPYQIPSGSMKPTLQIGDFIAVNKFSYGFRLPITGHQIIPVDTPEAGDIIVFKPPHEEARGKTFIKRVIGVPGDKIHYDYSNKKLWINDQEIKPEFIEVQLVDGRQTLLLKETLGDVEHDIYVNRGQAPYIPGAWISPKGEVIPEGKYFVMGDNRDNSHDSRYWGFVDEQAILGKAFAVWMHWRGFNSLPGFGRNRLLD